MTLPPSGNKVVLTRIRPTKNERRFYAVSITSDLFGNVLIVRNWGRIGTGGHMRHDTHDTFSSALVEADRIVRSKRKRGYAPSIGI